MEKFIREQNLSGLVMGSCVCCHLDFRCESCTDQRMRLKDRLFRQSGLEADRVALINLKETCFSPSGTALDHGPALARKLIRAGLLQLTERQAAAERPASSRRREVIVAGAGPAGTAAALGLANAGRPVTLVHLEDTAPEPGPEIQEAGIRQVKANRIIELRGNRGDFHLTVETAPGREELLAGEIILAQGRLSRLNYRSPTGRVGFSPGPRGSLETSIPGVYLASWPLARTVPPEEVGRAAAGLALEERPEPYLDISARVDPDLCRGCGECAKVCPEGAARLVADQPTPGGPGPEVCRVDPELCSGLRSVSGRLSHRGPEPARDRGRILRGGLKCPPGLTGLWWWPFCAPGLPTAAIWRPRQAGLSPPRILPVKIPCGGRIEPGLVLSALEKGAAGVAIVTCREGECRHGRGPELGREAADRLEKLTHLLGLGPERFKAFSCSAHETDLLVRELNGLAEAAEASPFSRPASGKVQR